MADVSTPPSTSPAALGDLARALLTASRAPALLLDHDGGVRMASDSFCRAFGLDPADVVGQPLATLQQFALPSLKSLLRSVATNPGGDGNCEIELERPDRTSGLVAINVQRLDDGGSAGGSLLVTVTDASARAWKDRGFDALLHDKDVLMQELRHRTANSLQIVANVLMHGARKTGSDEARVQLLNGYHRILSVAAIQQQLAITCGGDVDLQPYLNELCESIRASLIGAPARITLAVEVDEGQAPAETAASMGLLVTELVINALKHAFPDDREGTITVSFHNDGPAWTLSVGDTGVGLSGAAKGAGSGLGGNIVELTARKLGALVRTTGAAPGTVVSIVHA